MWIRVRVDQRTAGPGRGPGPGVDYHPSRRGRGAAAPAAMDVLAAGAAGASAQHWANKGTAERRTDHEPATGRSVGGHARSPADSLGVDGR